MVAEGGKKERKGERGRRIRENRTDWMTLLMNRFCMFL